MKRKGVYESPRLEIVDIRIEAGFAASGEVQITPGEDDGELGDEE